MPGDVKVKLMHYDIRPHTELHDILCGFINENLTALNELRAGDIIPQQINLSKPIDEIISLFAGKFFEAQKAE